MRLFLDTETFSETNLKTVGTYDYVPNTELLVTSWAVEDGPVQVWDYTNERHAAIGEEFAWSLATAKEVWAHNAQFDRLVIAKHFPHIAPSIERWRCTMACAHAHALPGSLEELAQVLGVPDESAKLGKDPMLLFCTPRPKNQKLRRATRATHPEEWERFLAYARNDVLAMRECWRRMPKWNYAGAELADWHRNQRINDRGFQIDMDLVEGALRVTDTEKARLAAKASELTAGEVESTAKRDALLLHILEEYGIDLPDLKSSTVEKFLESGYHGATPDVPPQLIELLEVRLQATTTSVAKYRRAKTMVSPDGRIRGTQQWCGAGRTGRVAHRGLQPGNLPRPSRDITEADIEIIKAGHVDLVYDDVMGVCSDALRGVIVAGPGKKLVVSDLSNIEGRAQAWLAGEAWKLDAFRAFDAGEGPDLYKASYGKSFNVDPATVDKYQRQIGKVQELMLGYGGGVGAYITGALTYGIDLDELADKAVPTIPLDVLRDAQEFYHWQVEQGRKTYGLDERVFVTCDSLKRMWRAAHPQISGYWKSLQQAAVAATLRPGETFECGKLKLRRGKAWLRIVLPSGRALCYAHPEATDDGKSISYMGRNPFNRKWQRLRTYGGKLFENVCQAVARDILFGAAPAIEASGYDLVLTVHDEAVTECDEKVGSCEQLSTILSTPPAWAVDMPLAAAGFEAYRYRKD